MSIPVPEKILRRVKRLGLEIRDNNNQGIDFWIYAF